MAWAAFYLQLGHEGGVRDNAAAGSLKKRHNLADAAQKGLRPQQFQRSRIHAPFLHLERVTEDGDIRRLQLGHIRLNSKKLRAQRASVCTHPARGARGLLEPASRRFLLSS